jgi:hypothetical protein
MGLMAKWKELSDIGIPISTPSPEAIVRAALERAAQTSRRYGSRHEPHGHPAMGDDEVKVLASCQITKALRALASDPAEVAAILKAAGEDRG